MNYGTRRVDRAACLQVKRANQNVSLSASCRMRGSPADVMRPKEDDARLELGPLKFTLLKALKNSARNCVLRRSVIFVFLMRPRSVLNRPGARKIFLPELPNVPRALRVKSAV